MHCQFEFECKRKFPVLSNPAGYCRAHLCLFFFYLDIREAKHQGSGHRRPAFGLRAGQNKPRP